MALDPWPVNFFRKDYGIDGEVKLARRAPAEFNATILPWSFEFQLKSKDWTNPLDPSIVVETRHLNYWLRHNVPTVLFSASTDGRGLKRAVYGRLIDKMFYQWLVLERKMWAQDQTVTITFDDADLVQHIEGSQFLCGSTDALESSILSWSRPLSPQEVP